MRTPERPIGVDLFCGAGGLSLGFEQAGFDVRAAVDYDPVHCGTHRFNFPACATICRDVAGIDGDMIRGRSNIGGRGIDVVFGGPPCQGFSMIGKRALDDPRNGLVHHFVRLVVDLQPRYFVFENVRGLTVGAHRRFLEEIVAEVGRRGYNVREDYRVLNAADFGVPQERKRLFLLGARDPARPPEYPISFFRQTPTVWDAIGDLPDADSFPELLESDNVRAHFSRASRYAARLRGLKEDPEDYAYRRRFDRRLLTSSLRTVHTPESVRRFLRTANGGIEPISRFLKLDPKATCNTLRAGSGAERGAFTSPRPIHPVWPRCITVREAARLHSYPDWFRFHATKWHGFRQVGNSVPPLLGRAVAAQIREALGLVPARPDPEIDLGDPSLLTLDSTGAAALFGVPSETLPRRNRVAKSCYA